MLKFGVPSLVVSLLLMAIAIYVDGKVGGPLSHLVVFSTAVYFLIVGRLMQE